MVTKTHRALQSMLSALIEGNEQKAVTAFHKYSVLKSREMIVNEASAGGHHANLSKATKAHWLPNVDKGATKGNALRKKPHKENLSKAQGPKFADESGKGSVKGNSLKNKPHNANLSKATKAKGPGVKNAPSKYDDGRDFEMGTANV